MKEQSIGGLWITKSRSGKEYYTGNVEIDGRKIKLAAFINKNKRNEKSPDISFYERTPVQTDDGGINVDDIPF